MTPASTPAATRVAVKRSLPAVGQGPRVQPGVPILSIGFRPFFLVAALFAALVVPYWLGVLLSGLPHASPFPAPIWHAHEMLFGYTSAVIAGFLLTATQNWTGRVTANGGALLGLTVLWVAGRVASALGAVALELSAAVDLAFLPALAFTVARPIVQTRNRRNAGMPVIVLVFAVANGLMWAGAIRGDVLMMMGAQRVALDVVALLIVVIGGRIIPGFTANATSVETRKHGAIDGAGIATMVALVAADLVAPRSNVVAHVALVAGVVNAARLWGWAGLRTLGNPLLSVLHVGFACTALALILRALAVYTGAFVESAATHLLTVGGIGAMTLGMMARVALGHTGRPLVLSRAMVVALYLLGLSAVVRVLTPILFASHYVAGLIASSVLWTVAFTLYVVVYTPVLLGPRADGRP